MTIDLYGNWKDISFLEVADGVLNLIQVCCRYNVKVYRPIPLLFTHLEGYFFNLRNLVLVYLLIYDSLNRTDKHAVVA